MNERDADSLTAGKIAERGQHRHFIAAAKAGEAQTLATFAMQLEDRMQMPGDDVMARGSGGRVPERKRAKD